MQLPIANDHDPASADAMVRAIVRAEMILGRTAADETDLDGATGFTNASRGDVGWVNFAAELTPDAEGGIEAVLDRIDAHFTERGVTCRSLLPAGGRWADAFAGPLTQRGYRLRISDVLRLASYARPDARAAVQLIPGRAAYHELHAIYDQMAADYGEPTGAGEAMVDRLDEPRAEPFLARADGRPAAVVTVLTLGQIGVIEGLWVRPEKRGRSIGRTLLEHAIDHCQRALFEHVILECEPGGEAADFYAAAGFQRIGELVRYVKADGA